MAKYMIHTCSKRKWYVQQYLVPSMLEQGIKKSDIRIYGDEKRLGNLRACIDSFRIIADKNGGTWHLQDDIIISSNFREATESEDKGIVCGFCNNYSKDMLSGYRPVQDMWYSFPCIRIPNKIVAEFIDWFYSTNTQTKYKAYIEQGKYDDSLFRYFILDKHPDMYVYNINPNIVDNIDYLIGGSIVNYQRSEKSDANSIYFEEHGLIEILSEKLRASSLQ